MNPGNANADEGMAGQIYDALYAILSPPFTDPEEEDGLAMSEEELEPVDAGWRRLGFAVASGVVAHLAQDPDREVEHAETFSSPAHDPAFWSWLTGLAGVLREWAALPPSDATTAELRSRLNTFFSTHTEPDSMKGILQ